MASNKYRLIVGIVLIILLAIIVFSACNVNDLLPVGRREQSPEAPAESQIYSPTDQTKAFVGSPIQVQSAHVGEDLVRVELYVNDALQRADIPTDGRVLQAWTPAQTGTVTIRVKAFNAQNQEMTNLSSVVQVLDNRLVEIPEVVQEPLFGGPTPSPDSVSQTGGSGVAIQPQQTCNFGEAAAPLLNSFTIAGVGDISAQTAGPVALPTDIGQQLVIDWNVQNADRFILEIQEPSGNVRRIPSQNQIERVIQEAPQAGQYIITFTARNAVCSSTLTRRLTKDVVVIPTATPTPVVMPAMMAPVPTPTPTAFYPPPPPAPGVPKGVPQDYLPELAPPVCDAAEFVDVYVPTTSQRVTISEPDVIPAKTVGGTLVHRAWRLRNTGTCTWGTGYELAFYGGRSMGSGGVTFDAFFPDEPERTNIIQESDRLIVPEGKPNQEAVLEVLLQAPVTPGIHQSYWRMRNPQGVYFGPILGVTLEVVRECNFGIYGAPVINRFEILGVGNVYQPVNPVEVQAEEDEQIVLDWEIINAENYDIIVRSPTGETKNIATGNRTDRARFVLSELGRHVITLYADNGSCTATAEVFIDVVPDRDNPFSFPIEILRISDNALVVNWNHRDSEVDEVLLYAQRYSRTQGEECLLGLTYPGWLQPVICQDNQWSDWRAVPGQPLPVEIVSVNNAQAQQATTTAPNLSAQNTAVVGDASISQGSRVSIAGVQMGTNAQGSAEVSNVEWGLCPFFSSNNPTPNQDFGVRYQLLARKNGQNAVPAWSNPVDLRCGGAIGGGGSSAGDAGAQDTAPRPNPGFNPD